MYLLTHTHTHTYIHTYIHIHIHTYIYIYTHRRKWRETGQTARQLSRQQSLLSRELRCVAFSLQPTETPRSTAGKRAMPLSCANHIRFTRAMPLSCANHIRFTRAMPLSCANHIRFTTCRINANRVWCKDPLKPFKYSYLFCMSRY